MDKCVYFYNGILHSHQKPQSPAICIDVIGTGGYYAKRNRTIIRISLVEFKKRKRIIEEGKEKYDEIRAYRWLSHLRICLWLRS